MKFIVFHCSSFFVMHFLRIEKDIFDNMNKVINETKKAIELESKIQELFSFE